MTFLSTNLASWRFKPDSAKHPKLSVSPLALSIYQVSLTPSSIPITDQYQYGGFGEHKPRLMRPADKPYTRKFRLSQFHGQAGRPRSKNSPDLLTQSLLFPTLLCQQHQQIFLHWKILPLFFRIRLIKMVVFVHAYTATLDFKRINGLRKAGTRMGDRCPLREVVISLCPVPRPLSTAQHVFK